MTLVFLPTVNRVTKKQKIPHYPRPLIEQSAKTIIMTHGFEDSSMPLEWSHQSCDFILRYGVDLECHNFHMDHTITAEPRGTIKDWLDKQPQ